MNLAVKRSELCAYESPAYEPHFPIGEVKPVQAEPVILPNGKLTNVSLRTLRVDNRPSVEQPFNALDHLNAVVKCYIPLTVGDIAAARHVLERSGSACEVSVEEWAREVSKDFSLIRD